MSAILAWTNWKYKTITIMSITLKIQKPKDIFTSMEPKNNGPALLKITVLVY